MGVALIKSKKRKVMCIILGSWALACGSGGSGGGGGETPPQIPQPFPQQSSSLHTSVGIFANEYKKLAVSPCVRFVDYVLPEMGSEERPFSLDGNLTDWASIPVHLTDPVGDAPASIDLASVQVSRVPDGLAFALAFLPTAQSHIFLEFGGVLSRSEDIVSEVKHFLRFTADGAYELRGDGWSRIDDGNVRFVSGVQGIEIFISDRLVGNATTWPVFWTRVIAQDVASGQWDSTHAAYFPSVLNDDALPFRFQKCVQWGGKPAKVAQVMITHYIPPPIDPSPDYVADGTFEVRREHAYQLGRLSLDVAMSLSGRLQYGAGTQSTLVSEYASHGAVTVNAATHLQQHPLVRDGRTYRLMGIGAKDMGFRPSIHFPQGEVIDAAVSFHLEHMLRNTFQSAGNGLIAVVGRSITKYFSDLYLGKSYWLNHRLPRIASFVDKPDTDAPVSVDQLLALKALGSVIKDEYYNAKVNAASQFFGEIFEADELADAWIEASKIASPASPLETKAALFVELLFAKVPTEDSRKFLKHCMDGYLISVPYEPICAPSVHLDRDQDGLPEFIENYYGLSDDKLDTDEDGWSDFVEMTGGFDANSASSVPGLLAADGVFSEWQTLLASKLHVDKGHSNLCSQDADIEFFGAVGTADYLMIGAIAKNFWNGESRARWEAVVDIPSEERVLFIVAPNKERVLQIKDPVDSKVLLTYPLAVPAGGRVLEILVDRQAMRLATPFNKEEGIKIRLRTAYETEKENIFCDETDWFTPYVR